MTPNPISSESPADEMRPIGLAFGGFLLSSIVVLIAYRFSDAYFIKQEGLFRLGGPGLPFNGHDGQWYKRIANLGYNYATDVASSAGFFPFYPLCCRAIMFATGVDADQALVLVSNAFLLGCFLLLALYAESRHPARSDDFHRNTMTAFALFPTTFFFHMGYSESSFVFVLLAYLFLIHRDASPFVVAAVAGLATSIRSPGIALLPATLYHLWRKEPRRPALTWKLPVVVALSCWGLLAFMAYLQAEFGEPLAFAKVQVFFKERQSPPALEKLALLATFEPIRSLMDPATSPPFRDPHGPLFVLGAADPLVFLGAMGLVAAGAWKRILTASEVLVSAGLLGFCYAAIGYESYMRSQGRYASAVVPIYFVMGRLLTAWRGRLLVPYAALATLFLFVYASLFLSGYFLV